MKQEKKMKSITQYFKMRIFLNDRKWKEQCKAEKLIK